MTKERIAQLREAWKHAQNELGRHYVWVTAGKECLDEIERLNSVVEKLTKVHHEWVQHSIAGSENCCNVSCDHA